MQQIIDCSGWGIDESGWLIFRDMAGEVSHVLKRWESIEVVHDENRAPDDILDNIDMKRGYCDI